jgi:hypothetical protein
VRDPSKIGKLEVSVAATLHCAVAWNPDAGTGGFPIFSGALPICSRRRCKRAKIRSEPNKSNSPFSDILQEYALLLSQ